MIFQLETILFSFMTYETIYIKYFVFVILSEIEAGFRNRYVHFITFAISSLYILMDWSIIALLLSPSKV